jgi:hypothetical protein
MKTMENGEKEDEELKSNNDEEDLAEKSQSGIKQKKIFRKSLKGVHKGVFDLLQSKISEECVNSGR